METMKHTKKTARLRPALCVVALLLSPACGDAPADDEIEAVESAESDPREVELEIDDFSESLSENMRVLAQMRAPGGSLVAFVADPDGDVIILEHGVDGTVPISDIAELEGATAYETFVAIADNDMDVPQEIAEAHIVTRGSLENLEGLEGFDLQQVRGFGDEPEDNEFRAFSNCTDYNSWYYSNSGIAKFYNCAPDGVGICINNLIFANNILDSQTDYKKNNRFSTCHRGYGKSEFRLISYHDGIFDPFFTRTSTLPGTYYRATRKNGSGNHRWRVLQYKAATSTGNPRVNTSLWGRNYFPGWF